MIPGNPISRSRLRLSSPTVWPCNSSESFHPGHKDRLSLSSPALHSSLRVSRRLANSRAIQGSNSPGHSVRHTLQDLGWVINWEKSNTVPSQDVVYRGARLDFRSGQAFPTQQRVDSVRSVAMEILSKRAPQARTWLRFLGLLASLVEILPFCRLSMHPLQFHIL